jgi:hypothetical protein
VIVAEGLSKTHGMNLSLVPIRSTSLAFANDFGDVRPAYRVRGGHGHAGRPLVDRLPTGLEVDLTRDQFRHGETVGGDRMVSGAADPLRCRNR